MGRLIDTSDLNNQIMLAKSDWGFVSGVICHTFEDIISKTPTAEPKTGHWIEIAKYSDGKHKIKCSECGSHIFDRGHANSFNVKNTYKYCPNCGTKMVESQESEE